MAFQLSSSVKALFTAKAAAANIEAIEAGLSTYGQQAELLAPHRLAHYLAQLAHESGGFRYDRELWGDTPAQRKYDTRTDLGNTPEVDGDGKLYMGRTAVQLTGKANYERFHVWCEGENLEPPDFVTRPQLLNDFPWEGVCPIWYWHVGNPTGKSLNKLADANNIEQITKKINGGLNGLADRLDWYTHIALAMCGFSTIRVFQEQASQAGFYDGEFDGETGPKTRAALHQWLAHQTGAKVTSGPVVTKASFVPKTVEEGVESKFSIFGWLGGALSSGGLGLASLAGMDWRTLLAAGIVACVMFLLALLLRGQIVAAIRDIRAANEAEHG
jgi:putative chitinase